MPFVFPSCPFVFFVDSRPVRSAMLSGASSSLGLADVEPSHLILRELGQGRRPTAMHLTLGIGKLPIGAVGRIPVELGPAALPLVDFDEVVRYQVTDDMRFAVAYYAIPFLQPFSDNRSAWSRAHSTCATLKHPRETAVAKQGHAVEPPHNLEPFRRKDRLLSHCDPPRSVRAQRLIVHLREAILREVELGADG